jgi:hypothetical protein
MNGVRTEVTSELLRSPAEGYGGYSPQGNSLNGEPMCNKRTVKCILLFLLILFIVLY